MSEVSIRELRNHGGDVIDRVVKGERLTITRDGRPVAELGPIGRRPVPLATLLARWAHLSPVDPIRVRRDLDEALDATL